MLIKAETNVPETREIFKSILERPEKVFELMRIDFREIAERTLCELLKVELSHHLGSLSFKKFESKSL